MAENRQKLIHLHSGNVNPTGSTNLVEQLINKAGLELGEIAVQHNSGAPKLYIKTGNDSIAEFIDKVAIEAYKINGKTLGSNPVLNGTDIELNGYVKPESTDAIAATDTINEALGKLEKGLENVGGDAITLIEAGNGIAVSAKANYRQTVSANIDETASAGVAVVIDDTSKKIKASVITVDDAANFINTNSGVTSAKGVKAFVDGEIGNLSVTDTAEDGKYVSQVSETNGKITVTRADIPVVGVANNDKVLSLDSDRKILSGLSFEYNSTDRKIYLYGSSKDAGHKIGEVDCSDFIKDGMLHDQKVFTTDASGSATVTFSKGGTHSYTGLTSNTKYIGLEFSDGAVPTPTYSYEALAVGELVDVYTSGDGIEISNTNVVSAKVVASNGLSVDSDGIKMGLATTDANGAMSSTDKAKLDGIAAGAQVNVLEGVQVNGSDLTITNKKVNVTVATGTGDGTIAVNNTDVAVKGLGSAAYTESTAYDESGAAATVETKVIGNSTDAASADTINGAKAYADSKITGLNATVGSQTVETGKHVAVKVVEADGKLTSLTVTESDIASESDLNTEIAARKAVDGISGNTYSATTAATYISGATSLNDADQKLDAALKGLDGEAVKLVTIKDGKASGVALDNTDTQNPKFDFSELVINCGTF